MYDDEPYNDAELEVIRHVAEDLDSLENGRPARKRPLVSRREKDKLDVNLSVKNTNQRLRRLPLAILLKIYQNLQRIDLSGHEFEPSGLPWQLEKCEKLYYLKLEYCGLTRIPDVVCRMQALVLLDISYNGLDHIPPEFQDLKQLRVLYLSYNQFRELPAFLPKVGSLKTIDVTGNPLEAPPREIWDTTLPQNRGLDGRESTLRILQWLAEWRQQMSSTADFGGPEPMRPGSLVPRPLNLNANKSTQSLVPAGGRTALESKISKPPGRPGSPDTAYSDALTEAPDITLNAAHGLYVARKVGRAYLQLVHHLRAELTVSNAGGYLDTRISNDFVSLMHALEECSKDLLDANFEHGGVEKVKAAVYCGARLLSDLLRSFVDDVAPTAENDVLEDVPTMFEMVDKNIAVALREVGVRFKGANSMERINSLFEIAGLGSITFSYGGQPDAGNVTTKVPRFNPPMVPVESTDSMLSYANSAMDSSTDLRQTTRYQGDEPYELVGEVVDNCAAIRQGLAKTHSGGHVRAGTPQLQRLWNDTLVALENLEQAARTLHTHLANVSPNDLASVREPCAYLTTALLTLKNLLKHARQKNLVSEQTMAAFRRIREATGTALRLLDGAQSTPIPPGSAISTSTAGSASSYAPKGPMDAALGPAVARILGSNKDTSPLFKKIEDLNRNQRRF